MSSNELPNNCNQSKEYKCTLDDSAKSAHKRKKCKTSLDVVQSIISRFEKQEITLFSSIFKEPF